MLNDYNSGNIRSWVQWDKELVAQSGAIDPSAKEDFILKEGI